MSHGYFKISEIILLYLEGCNNGMVTSSLEIEGRSVPVRCDDSKDMKGAWTAIQRRGQFGNPRYYFYKAWEEYESGFGSVQQEFWIGLENLHRITKVREWELQVNLTDWDGRKYFALYNSFMPRTKISVWSFRI